MAQINETADVPPLAQLWLNEGLAASDNDNIAGNSGQKWVPEVRKLLLHYYLRLQFYIAYPAWHPKL